MEVKSSSIQAGTWAVRPTIIGGGQPLARTARAGAAPGQPGPRPVNWMAARWPASRSSAGVGGRQPAWAGRQPAKAVAGDGSIGDEQQHSLAGREARRAVAASSGGSPMPLRRPISTKPKVEQSHRLRRCCPHLGNRRDSGFHSLPFRGPMKITTPKGYVIELSADEATRRFSRPRARRRQLAGLAEPAAADDEPLSAARLVAASCVATASPHPARRLSRPSTKPATTVWTSARWPRPPGPHHRESWAACWAASAKPRHHHPGIETLAGSTGC